MKTLILNTPYFRNNEYTTFPIDVNKALNDLGLGISEKLFYIGFITVFGTEATVSQVELAEILGISETTIQRIIISLQEKGLLKIKSGIGRSVKNHYKIKYVYCDKIENAVGL